MKTKQVNVTLEIPEHLEVGDIYGTANPTVLAVSLVQRKPNDISYSKDSNETVYELVKNKC